MMRRWWVIALALAALLLAACGEDSNEPEASPSPPPPTEAPSPTVVLAAPTQTPAGATRAPSRTVPPTITATSSPTAGPATATPTITPTPGPYDYVMQSGDDCIGILYKHGFNDLAAIDVLLALNSLQDCRQLPGPGTHILVPRPTPTATPEGYDITQTAVATSAPPMVTLEVVAPSFAVRPYTVQQDDTLSSIAIAVDSSLRQLCEMNAGVDGIDCRGCQWESAHCCCPNPPVLSVGQQINVPAPTPTPTFTPTFTGSETPSPTPTHRAPQPVYPADGATVAGPVRLSWVTVGTLAPDEAYLVTLRDETSGEIFSTTTRQLSQDVPGEYLPQDGAPHRFVWQVSVVREGTNGVLVPVGPALAEQQFTWRGWE